MNKQNLLLTALVGAFAFWCIGVLLDVWANPLFQMFWILPHETANNFAYVGLFLSGLYLVIETKLSIKKQVTAQQTTETLPEYVLKQTKIINVAPKPLQAYPYVTIEGKEPPEPTSLFSTKAFKIVGSAFAVLIGLMAYFLVFA